MEIIKVFDIVAIAVTAIVIFFFIIGREQRQEKFMTVKTKYKDMDDIIGIDFIINGTVKQAIRDKENIWYLEVTKKVGERLIKYGHAKEISKEEFLQVINDRLLSININKTKK